MIVALNGKVVHKEPTLVHIDVNGVVYEVFISLQSYAELRDERVVLHTSHIIREDAQLLYGFVDRSEKLLFERLIKINGVGPKVAMAICSTFSSQEFALVISGNDLKAMQRVPGVGPKSAGRILVELNGFDLSLVDGGEKSASSKATSEAMMALEQLGFKKDAISKALEKCTSSDTASLVKEALKKL
ncbi:MAG: Holliday junction branch migration protein RuvA [Sulfuricurvum sp.]